jgi:cytochrome c oxidase assembly protein subunit 15
VKTTNTRQRAAGTPTRRQVPGPLRPLLAPSPRWMLWWAMLSLVANILIIVTGGAVRLTGSGLGCPTWPRCTESSYTPTGEMGIHGVIEFSNRMLAFVVGVVAIATFVAAVRYRPKRPDLRRLAFALGLGIPLQALVGGITVLTALNPWVVMLHFLASALMVGLAMVLVRRAGEGDLPPRPVVQPLLRRLVAGMVVVTGGVVYLGTVTTGSGPHAGDLDSIRTGLDPVLVSQLHADLVFLLIGLTIATVIALIASGAPPRARRAAWTLLAIELAQGGIGYTQYFLGLPELLVGLHLLGASLTVAGVVNLLLATRDRGPVVVEELSVAGSRAEAAPSSEPATAMPASR